MTSEQTEIIGLNKLKESDWNKALDCLTDAFSEDPCFLYLLQSDKYEPEKARFIHDYTLKYGYKSGNVYVTSSGVEGVSVWLPPKTNNHSTLMHVWNFIICGGLKMDSHVIWRHIISEMWLTMKNMDSKPWKLAYFPLQIQNTLLC